MAALPAYALRWHAYAVLLSMIMGENKTFVYNNDQLIIIFYIICCIYYTAWIFY